MEICINPTCDAQSLGRILQEHRRLQVPRFFPDEVAEYLYGLLIANETWYTTYNEGDQHYEIPPEGMAAMSAAQRQKFLSRLMQGARDGFQYCFQQYDITDAIKRGEDAGHPLHAMNGFVNSDAFLDFIRVLTGEPATTRSDCYASRYVPGNFLTEHNDRHESEDRVAAFVISMTRGWRRNWGGHLLFFDEQGNVIEGFVPSYNTLNIFLVPQSHAVSYVTPFAGQSRTSFLGWAKR